MKAKVVVVCDGIETLPDGTQVVRLAVEFLAGEIRAVYRKHLGGPGVLIYPPGVKLGPRVVHRLMDLARKKLESVGTAVFQRPSGLTLVE